MRLAQRLTRASTLLVLTGAAGALLPASANASGFSVARFGGTHGNPTETNPTTLYYNPAGLVGAGTKVYLDVTYAWRTAEYERPASSVDVSNSTDESVAANSGKGTLSNTVLAPALLVSSDLGLDLPFAIGAGFFVPFGGAAVWEDQDDMKSEEFPGAIDGPQRWWSIDGTLRTLGFGFGVAGELPGTGLSLGLAGNLYKSEINTIRARNADGTDNAFSEGRSLIDVTSTDFGVGAGLLYEAMPEKLWLGLSYQSRPNFDGKMKFEGELTNYFTTEDKNDLAMTSQLPDVFRAGARFRPAPNSEVRLFGDFTRWSALESQCLVEKKLLGSADIYEYCKVDAAGVPIDRGDTDGDGRANRNQLILNIDRHWDDAWGVRAGGSYWTAGKTEIFVDLGYDANAVPDEALEPSLMDMDKFSFGSGATIPTTRFMDVSVSLNDVFYAERDTSGTKAGSQFDRTSPTLNPNAAGVFNQNVLFLNLGLNFHFGDKCCDGCDDCPEAKEAARL